MKFKLPTFTLLVRDLTSKEWAKQTDRSRDYTAVVINAKCLDGSREKLTCIVGSPRDGEWSQAEAARSAISFASELSCWDSEGERAWVEEYGETLTNEAFIHNVLGTELRR